MSAMPPSPASDLSPTAFTRPVALPMQRGWLTALWGRIRPLLLVGLPLLFAGLAIAFAAFAWRGAQTNRTIAGLRDGSDIAVESSAPVAALLARLQFLAQRDRLDEAEALIGPIEHHADADLIARARFFLANARLRQAFGHLSRGNIDPAGPLVMLARQDYRRSLQARPDFWDAKFNFDVASRLIRDFPDFDRKHGDEMQAEPKKIWTDIPGQPRGAP